MRTTMQHYCLSHGTYRLGEKHKDMLTAATQSGLAESPSAALRDLLEAAASGLNPFPSETTTMKDTNTTKAPWPERVQELMRDNPGMSFRAACAELGNRSQAKRASKRLRERDREQRAEEASRRARERLVREDELERERVEAATEEPGA